MERRRAWMEFWRGATTPTWLVLGISVVVATATYYLCTATITERWMARYGELFSDGSDDVHAAVTTEALRIKSSASETPELFLVGDLLGRRCVIGDELPIGSSIQPVVDLRTPRQTVYESIILVDQLPLDVNGNLVLIVTPEILQISEQFLRTLQDQPRLGVRSVAATAHLMRRGIAAIPFRSNYFADNQSYLLSRAPVAFWNGLQSAGVDDWKSTSTSRSVRVAKPTMSAPSDEGYTNLIHRNIASLESLIRAVHRRRSLRMVVAFVRSDDSDVSSVLWERVEWATRQHGEPCVICNSARLDEHGLPIRQLRAYLETKSNVE